MTTRCSAATRSQATMRAVLRSPRFLLGEGGVAGKGTVLGVSDEQKDVADPTVC